jgi:AcrR family transcriptional regulator
MVLNGTNGKKFFVKRSSIPSPQPLTPEPDSANPKRTRVVSAALAAFHELGFSASTLEIATRAKVSKRELYTLFSNKHDLLTACIAERAQRMRFPLESPASFDRQTVTATLVAFGTAILRGVSDQSTLAVFRLAIAESENSPEIARMLDAAGRQANLQALSEFLKKAGKSGQLVPGKPETLAALFFASLWGDLLIRLLLRVVDPPTPQEIARRARLATDAILKPNP